MAQRWVNVGFGFLSWSLLHLFHLSLIGTSYGGSSWNVVIAQASWDAWKFTRSQGKLRSIDENKSQRNGASASGEKSACQMGANAREGSWEELEPHGIRRIDHTEGPGANLELERSGESELTSPADQLGSHQRARWNDFIQPKAPFRTRARVAWLVPMAHNRVSDEPSPGNPTSGPNEVAVLETAWETVMKYLAKHCKLPMLLHCYVLH